MGTDENYLLSLRESETVEIKEAFEKIPLSFYESYCAMANGSGGTIYLGIAESEPQNIIKGVQNAPQKIKQLCNTLTLKSKIANNDFKESDVSIIKTSSGDVIAIRVKPVPIDQRPVYLNGDPTVSYKRVGDCDKLLDEDEIRGMVNDSSKVRFDQRPNIFGIGFDDLDPYAVERFVSLAKVTRRISSVETMSAQQILARIGAITIDPETKKEVATNGGVMFFGKSVGISAICPSLWMDYCEKEDDNDRFSFRITNRDLDHEPNMFSFFERVDRRLFEVLPSPFHVGSGGRNDGKTIVHEIVREALANSISNLETGSSTGLLIERRGKSLRFKNAGGMLTGLTQALRGGVSKPRNQCVFTFFLAIGITDHGGYGVPAIFDKMRELGMVEPHLEESFGRDETTLHLVFSRVGSELSKEEKHALLFLAEHPLGTSSSDLAQCLGVSRDTARRILLGLTEKGEVKDNGKQNKGRLYFAKDSNLD